MGVVGAPFELLDTGFAMATSFIAELLPGFPAATLLSPHVGTPHAHLHPLSLTPPNPVPVPLPSIGMLTIPGAVNVLIAGMPAARAGDIGMAPTCVGLFPLFDVFTGSSNTWIAGSRAARMGDITWHCNIASAANVIGMAMGAVGVIAGAVGAGAAAAAGQAAAASAAAAQAAADAVALAASAFLGKDPGIPPTIGAIMSGVPNVLIGGFPMPDVLAALGGLAKAAKKAGKAIGKSKGFGKIISKVGLCNDPGEPVNSFTGEVYNDFEDYVAFDTGLSWERHYRSGWNRQHGPLGFGYRHFFQRTLTLRRKRAVYETHDNEQVGLEKLEDGSYASVEGFALVSRDGQRFELTTDRDELLVFQLQPTSPPTGRLARYKSKVVDVYCHYDDRGRLHALSEVLGGVTVDTSLVYDADAHIVEVRRGWRNQAALTVARYVYQDGCIVEHYDALGAVKRFRYDSEHRMVQGSDRRGYSFHWYYDEKNGRCIKSHGDDGLWGIEARYEGAQSFFKEADGSEWAFKHYPDGAISHIVGPDGGVMKYVRDDRTGRIVKQVTPGGTEFRWLYDRAGNHYARSDQWAHQLPPEDLDPSPRDPLAHDGPLTHKSWLWGRPLEQLSEALLDLPHAVLAKLQRIQPAPYSGAPDPVRDPAGRILERRADDGTVERFHYDGEGNIMAAQDCHGNWAQKSWTSWNLLAAEQTPMGAVTQYSYTHREALGSISDPCGNRTEFVRDPRQRIVEERRNGRVYRKQAYDMHGRIVKQWDGGGTLLQQLKSGRHGLPTEIKLRSGAVYSYEYDSHGRPTRASSAEHEVTLEHMRHLRQADRRDAKGIQHVYGTWEEVRRTTYFGRFVVRYDYQGAPGVRIRTPEGGRHSLQRHGQHLVVRVNGNGTHEVTQFDSRQRLCTRVCWQRSEFGQAPAWTQSFRYSAADELLSWSDSDTGNATFEYDADRRLIAEQRASGRRSYAYDAAGNLTRTPEHGLIEYHDARLLSHADFDHFEYDSECRRSRASWRGQGSIDYSYDERGQLVRVRWSDRDDEWSAHYDGLGRRIWKQYGKERTDFYWDGDRLAAERFPNGSVRIYVYANEDSLVPFMWLDYATEDAEPESGQAFYVYGAPNGMPLCVEDAERNVVWRVKSMSPYGAIELRSGASVELRLRFAGHFYDEHLGLHYNRYRDYDPRFGRYLQPDPIGHEGGVNLYAYPSSPLVEVDLLGLVHRKGPVGVGPDKTKALQDAVAADAIDASVNASSNKDRRRKQMVGGVRNKRTGDIFTANNAEARAARDAGKLNDVVQRRVDATGKVIDAHEELTAPPPKGKGKTHQDVRDMSDEEIRAELDKKGIPPEQDGMDTTEQMRRVNERADHKASGGDPDPHASMRDENGAHGETKATSDALDHVEATEGRKATGKDIEDLEMENKGIPYDPANPPPAKSMPRCGLCDGNTHGVQPTPELKDAESGMPQNRR
jgi:RHS repeat-associated protein